jgi:hypothetical protein
MTRKIQYLEIRFFLGSVSVLVGLVGATIALFQWVDRTGLQHLFGGCSRYVLGFGGFAAMILGALLVNDAWVLTAVLKGKYELPTDYSLHAPPRIYIQEEPSRQNHQRDRVSTYETDYRHAMIPDIVRSQERRESLRGKLTRFLRKLAGRTSHARSHVIGPALPRSIIRLPVIPKPTAGTRVIFEGNATPVIEGSGSVKMVCDRCEELLVDGARGGPLKNGVVRCPTCRSYCVIP